MFLVRFLPSLVAAVLGVLSLLRGHSGRAIAFGAVAVVVAVAELLGLSIQRYVARGAELLATLVSRFLAVAVGLVLVLVGWAMRLVRSDPLVPKRLRSGWVALDSAGNRNGLPSSAFSIDNIDADSWVHISTPRRLVRLALKSVLVVGVSALSIALLLLVVDAGRRDPSVVADRLNFSGRTDTVHDPRADSAAMRPYPWADEYFREAYLASNTYWPFTESKPLPFKGKYVNIGSDWSRATYTQITVEASAVEIWMFGGSTTWGVGQRDNYTIASDLVRIAEKQQVPLKVGNLGQNGWTHFQEMLLFQQLLMTEHAPDIAVFYDGANELNTQTLGVRGVPSHHFVKEYADRISGGLWGNALSRDLNRANESGTVTYYNRTWKDAAAAKRVYESGREITQFLANEHSVKSIFLWQPVRTDRFDEWMNKNVSRPTIDISYALDLDQDVYIDYVHTNEKGAQIVAEHIWTSLYPIVKSVIDSR